MHTPREVRRDTVRIEQLLKVPNTANWQRRPRSRNNSTQIYYVMRNSTVKTPGRAVLSNPAQFKITSRGGFVLLPGQNHPPVHVIFLCIFVHFCAFCAFFSYVTHILFNNTHLWQLNWEVLLLEAFPSLACHLLQLEGTTLTSSRTPS
jgi:hypothetical protein